MEWTDALGAIHTGSASGGVSGMIPYLATDITGGAFPGGSIRWRNLGFNDGLGFDLLVTVSTSPTYYSDTITIQYWSRAYWNDPRLGWNATEWGINTITFGPGEVWQPDEYIYETQELISQVPAIGVSSDGAVFRSAHRVSTLGCKMQLRSFPFDSQVCEITVRPPPS